MNKKLKEIFLDYENKLKVFVDWSSDNKIKNILCKKILYENYSIWWSTNIINRRNEKNKNWKDFLLKNKKNKKIIFLNIFKIFYFYISNIYIKIFLKLFSEKKIVKKNNQEIIIFHSLFSNIIKENKIYKDRLFNHAPYESKKYNFKTIKLIMIFPESDFFFHPYQFYKKLKDLNNTDEDNIFYANNYLSFYEITKVFLKNFFLFFKMYFYVFMNKDENLFKIKGINEKILIKEFLFSSFEGPIQNSLIYGLGIKNFFLKKNINFKLFITYGEFLPYIRSCYYFLKKSVRKIQIVSIQHTIINNYKIQHHFKSIEFNGNFLKNNFFSPKPDFIFCNSNKSQNFFSNFFPRNKIKIIGNLKYSDSFKKKIQIYNKKKFNSKKIILLMPSIDDEMDFIKVFKNFDLKKYDLVLAPHPSYKKRSLKIFKKNLTCNYKVYPNKSSLDLLKEADFVVTSKSSMFYEAIKLNKKIIKVYDPNKCPNFNYTNLYPIVTNYKELKVSLKNSKHIIINKEDENNIKHFKSSLNFWKYIQILNPKKQSY
jgi:hypothetical protein